MEATSIYPNSAPVLAANGLGVTLAGNDPDHVPLEPNLINDPRRRFAPDGSAVDASGVMRLHVRNALGYAFLRPYHVARLRSARSASRVAKEADWKTQASFYRHNYRHFVPHDLMMDLLEKECPLQEDGQNISKWQGNAIAGVECGQDGHVVFYPTGQVLQQACAWYSKGELEEDPPCSSTVIETGAVIRQFSVMGSKDAYHLTSAAKIFAAARGCTNCTIIAAPARVTTGNMQKMQAKAKISFSETINHVAGSPHAEAEVALVTADGIVRWWDPEGGIRIANKNVNMPDRLLRCEYSSHPRVLWAVNRVIVSALDLRQPAQHASNVFDVAGTGTYITIYDVKHRASNPFQFVVGTGVSIELVDSRMARQPLVSWIQPQSYSGESEFSFGAIDEVDMSRNANDLRGYIVSSLKRPKVTTLFPFKRNRKRRRGKVLSLTSLRSDGDDEYSEISRTSVEQLVASDATLDLHMEDGGEYTNLTGICALRNEESASASIYQLNSLGDLFSHRVLFDHFPTQSYRAAVQADLPCGVTAQTDTMEESVVRTLPIPLDAILPEHDTESMQRFVTLPIKVLRRQFPRLPEDRDMFIEIEDNKAAASNSRRNNESIRKEDNDVNINRNCRRSLDGDGNDKAGEAENRLTRKTHSKCFDENKDEKIDAMISGTKRSRSFDKIKVVNLLVDVCDPSTSLFRLHRYVLDELKIILSSSELLQLLRSSNKFRIRTVHHTFPADAFRVRNPSLPGADAVHWKKDDPRLASCACRPMLSSSQLPCDSWACVIPHAVIVSSTSTELHLDDTASSSAHRQEMPIDLADIIVAAQAVYDDMYESSK